MAERETTKSAPGVVWRLSTSTPPPISTVATSEPPDSDPDFFIVGQTGVNFQVKIAKEGAFGDGGAATLYFTLPTQESEVDASVTLESKQSSAAKTTEHASQAMFCDVDLALARLELGIGHERTALDALLLRLTDKPA